MSPTHLRAGRDERKVAWINILIAFVVVGFINLRLVHFDRSEEQAITAVRFLFGRYFDVSYVPLLEVIVLYGLLGYLRERLDRWPLIYLLPSVVFGIFAVEGRYFETADAVDFFSSEKFFIMLSLLSCLGYTAAYYIFFVFADHFFEHHIIPSLMRRRESAAPRRITAWIEEHPFLFSVILLAVLSIPLYAISYPAFFMGDAREQIRQALGLKPLMDKHPIIHTLLIRLCLNIGMSLFHSENVGIFLVTLVQGLMLILSYSFCADTLIKVAKVPTGVALTVPLIVFLHPRCQQYLFLITKDGPYCALLIAFLCFTMRQFFGQSSGKLEFAGWAIVSILMCLMRKEGLYVLMPVVLLIGLCKGMHLKSATLLALVLGTTLLFSRVIYPAMGVVHRDNSRILYAHMFQMTARYIRDYPDDVTAEERAAIEGVVNNYDWLTEVYDEKLYDGVKRLFIFESTKSQRQAYRAAWVEMFRKHPDSYIRAFANFKYEYFYPSTVSSVFYKTSHSDSVMTLTNKQSDMNFDMSEDTYRRSTNYEYLREGWFRFLGLGLIVSSFFFVCSFAFLACFVLRRRMWKTLLMMLVPLLQIGVLLLGPTGGYYFRYTVPLASILPLYALFVCGMVWRSGSLFAVDSHDLQLPLAPVALDDGVEDEATGHQESGEPAE